MVFDDPDAAGLAFRRAPATPVTFATVRALYSGSKGLERQSNVAHAILVEDGVDTKRLWVLDAIDKSLLKWECEQASHDMVMSSDETVQ